MRSAQEASDDGAFTMEDAEILFEMAALYPQAASGTQVFVETLEGKGKRHEKIQQHLSKLRC